MHSSRLMAEKWSVVKGKPVKELLGNINSSLIQWLLKHKYGGDTSKVPTIDYLAVKPTGISCRASLWKLLFIAIGVELILKDFNESVREIIKIS